MPTQTPKFEQPITPIEQELVPQMPEISAPIESEHTPEQFLEEEIQQPTQPEKRVDTHGEQLRKNKTRPTTVVSVRDDTTVKIEKIMEDGLVDAFKAMTPAQQQEFKIAGEKTAYEIRAMIKSGKVKIKKVFQLLVNWLKLIPGINRFFIEQEAKIKADKINALKQHETMK